MAAPMLLEERRVKFVAYELGCKQHSHCSHQFKQLYGLSAKELLLLHDRLNGKALVRSENRA